MPTSREILIEQIRRAARGGFEPFFRAFPPSRRYIYGRHTLAMLAALDEIVRDVRAGRSRYAVFNLPFRHGKSDIASRRLAPYIFCTEPDGTDPVEIIEATYNFDLSSDMSYDARRAFEQAGPYYGRAIADDRGRVGSWRTSRGDTLHAAGLGGTITGRGATYLIIDDYHKNAQEAESELVRDRIWTSFATDLMTRSAPVSAVIIVANRWGPDDLCGRIEERNDPSSEHYDADFPSFDFYRFPAQDENGDWLFPERFGPAWYRARKAALSSYMWAALAQQSPALRSGNFLKVERVVVLDPIEFDRRAKDAGGVWRRGWDLASSEKQRASEDPDYTVGTKAKYAGGAIYVADVERGQWTAPKRNRVMQEKTIFDGPGVTVRIEGVAGYKDTVEDARAKLDGFAVVEKVTPDADKVSRAAILEPAFEAGRVYVRSGAWVEAWRREFEQFPKGKKDDQVDSLVVALHSDILDQASDALGIDFI